MDKSLFDFEKFDIKLDTDWVGRQFFYVEELDSTNNYLLNYSMTTLRNGAVAFAEKQLKGRGRMDRTWYSSKNLNLLFSVFLSEEFLQKKRLNMINLGSAVVVANAIENLHQLSTDLKWPNDILIDRKKVAGILIESTSNGNKLTKAVCGVGLNVNQTAFQGEFKIPPTSIALEQSRPADREKLFAEILNTYEEMLEQLLESPDRIAEEWKSNCRMLGEKIIIDTNGETKEGIFEDIDENGYLLLKNKRGVIETITYGDVSII